MKCYFVCDLCQHNGRPQPTESKEYKELWTVKPKSWETIKMKDKVLHVCPECKKLIGTNA